MGDGVVTEAMLDKAVDDVVADQGVIHAVLTENWRRELTLTLGSFRNEVRMIAAGALILSHVHVPSSVTVGAALAFSGKIAYGAGKLVFAALSR